MKKKVFSTLRFKKMFISSLTTVLEKWLGLFLSQIILSHYTLMGLRRACVGLSEVGRISRNTNVPTVLHSKRWKNYLPSMTTTVAWGVSCPGSFAAVTFLQDVTPQRPLGDNWGANEGSLAHYCLC